MLPISSDARDKSLLRYVLPFRRTAIFFAFPVPRRAVPLTEIYNASFERISRFREFSARSRATSRAERASARYFLVFESGFPRNATRRSVFFPSSRNYSLPFSAAISRLCSSGFSNLLAMAASSNIYTCTKVFPLSKDCVICSDRRRTVHLINSLSPDNGAREMFFDSALWVDD